MQLSKADLKLIEAAAATQNTKRRSRTISLDEEQYDRFQAYCQDNNLAANKVIDKLIELFLEAAE